MRLWRDQPVRIFEQEFMAIPLTGARKLNHAYLSKHEMHRIGRSGTSSFRKNQTFAIASKDRSPIPIGEEPLVNRRRGDEQAKPDELGNDPGQVGPDSAGQSGDGQRLASVEGVANQSVQELADSDQGIEA